MKTNAKKRMLISSVAMLLVAMIALGTATFAWFTNTTTAKADKAQVTVAAPSGLVIAAVEAGADRPALTEYKSTIDISGLASKTMTPVSGNAEANTISFYEASVDNDKNVTKITSGTAGENYIAIDIYAMLSASNKDDAGAEVAKNVNLSSIAAQGNTPGQVVRCAYYGFTTATPSKTAYVNFGTADRVVNPLKTTAATLTGVTTNDNFVIPATQTNYVADALTASTGFSASTQVGTAKYVTKAEETTKIGTIYLWVEGQDELCNNANVTTITGATNNISFNFALAE